MLEHLGEKDGAGLLMQTIEKLTSNGKILTKDLGGSSSTTEVTEEVLRLIETA
jgi:isocitrate/isopropylmalate dehydrogenase